MDKIKTLLNEMTIREKLAQMTQIMGDCFMTEGFGKLMGISYGFDISDDLAWNLGSILGLGGAEKTIKIQKDFIEKNRHGIPLLFMSDIIHGYRTIFPSPLGMACSWDPDIFMKASEIAAREASVSGVHVTFAPMADLAVDARWGRVIEGTGEDPMLGSIYAAAAVKGFQGDNLGKHRIVSCVKHFAAYGAAEAGRDYNTTQVSEYDLNERFLPAYKAAIDAGCLMIMTAFNSLNGVPCTGDSNLFKDLLRDKWGFKGTVISDCTAICEMVPHGYCENDEQAAEAALKAGVDIEMVSTTFFNHTEKLLSEGKIDINILDEAVERILDLKQMLGLFENPYRDASIEEEKSLHLCSEHRRFAREAAARSTVLLKNENQMLPLKTNEKIALIGPYSDNNMLSDIWKCEGRDDETITLHEGFRGKLNVSAAKGCELLGYGEISKDLDDELLGAAIKVAGECDKIVLCLGEHSDMSSEAGSRGYLTLPENQLRLARSISCLGKSVAIVLFHGRPLELAELVTLADAILLAWFPGTEGGNGIADVLLGTVPPSGRLAMTFPYSVGQLPLYYNALPTGRPKHGVSDNERFRSRYLDMPNEPLYPFGYGLTYTQFDYSEILLSANELAIDSKEIIKAQVVLKNTGDRTGTEIVQMYIRDLGGSYSRPVRMLKGFQRVELAPGESDIVEFEISVDMLKYHTRFNGFAAEKGGFKVFIGADSSTLNSADFALV